MLSSCFYTVQYEHIKRSKCGRLFVRLFQIPAGICYCQKLEILDDSCQRYRKNNDGDFFYGKQRIMAHSAKILRNPDDPPPKKNKCMGQPRRCTGNTGRHMQSRLGNLNNVATLPCKILEAEVSLSRASSTRPLISGGKG